MPASSKRRLLEVLRAELQFLEQGGYRKPPPQQAWRAPYVFEDSPNCLNYNAGEERRPCAECALIHFVPPEQREEAVPCRHIPLTETGDTLNSIYQWATQEEIEQAVGAWLRTTIRKLEQGEHSSEEESLP